MSKFFFFLFLFNLFVFFGGRGGNRLKFIGQCIVSDGFCFYRLDFMDIIDIN